MSNRLCVVIFSPQLFGSSMCFLLSPEPCSNQSSICTLCPPLVHFSLLLLTSLWLFFLISFVTLIFTTGFAPLMIGYSHSSHFPSIQHYPAYDIFCSYFNAFREFIYSCVVHPVIILVMHLWTHLVLLLWVISRYDWMSLSIISTWRLLSSLTVV